MDFAEWLASKIRERRLTQRQVAMRTGIDHGTVSRLLDGRRVPTARTLARLARLFGWPPLDVVDPPTPRAADGPSRGAGAG